MTSYIGKIAAVGTINVSQIASGLNASARDVEKYARGLQSTISSANAAAGRSFKEIFTPLQRLERALQAVQNRTIDIKVDGGVERIRAIVGAANDIAKPLGAAQKQFTTLSAAVQNEFVGALVRAQNAAQLAENAINKGQIKNAAGYQKLKAIVDSVTESQERLSEAGAAVSGLATGRELRFQQPGFASEVNRSQRLQQSAASLPPDVIQSAAVASSVAAIRQEAEEAERLNAALENVKNTRSSDTAAIAAAQAALDAQTAKIAGLNDQLDRQVSLYSDVAKQREAVKSFAALVPSLQQGLDFKITGNFQSIQQARSAVEGLFSQLQKLDSGQVGALSGGVGDLFAAIQTGDLNAIQVEYEKLKKSIEDGIEANVRTKDSQKQIDDLRKAARGLSDDFDFAALGVPQSIDQATAAAKNLVSELAKLSQNQISALTGDFQSLFSAIESGDLAAFQATYARVKAAIEDGIKTNLDTTAADKRLADLQATWNRVSSGVITRAEDVDKKFNDLSNTIAKLTSGNRLNLNPLAASFLAAVKAGAPLADQLRLIEDLATRASLAAKIETLPANSNERRRLQTQFDALSSGLAAPSSAGAIGDDINKSVSSFDLFGAAVDDSSRRLGVLQGAINSVKGQVDQLPIPLQARFVPLLSQAEAEFQRLKNSGATTATEIEAAARNAQKLRDQVAAAASLERPDGLFPRGTGAEAARDFEAVEKAFRFVGATTQAARAPLEQWRQALQNAIAEGTQNLPAVRQQIDQLRKAAIDAGAAFGGISAGKFLSVAKNFGDVGRAGVDKFGLALNQLAFVFDDFTSASGGLDMKFRAIQNNLTQIGFILGSTTGLWIALGAAIGGQVVVQIVKWLYQTDLQKARLQELNDALKAQESSVNALADAYRRLSQEISRAGATGFESRAAGRDERVEEIRRIAEERQRQTVAELSPEVADIRGRRAILEERLQGERNLQRRVTLQNEIERNRRQEQAAVSRGAPALDAAGVRDQLISAEEERVRQTQVRLNRARLRERLGGVPPAGEDVATVQAELDQRRAGLAARQAAGAAPTRREQLSQLRGTLSDLESQRARVVTSGARTTEIDVAIDDVTTAIRRIEASLAPAVQRVVEQITRQSLSIAATLEDGSRLIADSLGDSAEARDLRRAIRATAEEVARLQTAASNAATPEEAREAGAALTRERRRADELRSRAQQVSVAAAVDPQALFSSALERVQANLQQAGAPQGILARRARELAARRESLIQDLDAENPFVRGRAERALPAVDEQIRQVEAATLALRLFADGLNRASQVVQSDLDSARQEADEARRRDIAFSTPETRRDRDRTEQNFRDQQDAATRAQAEIERARVRQEQEAIDGPFAAQFAELQNIEQQLQAGTDVNNVERERLVARREELQRQLQPEVDRRRAESQALSEAAERRREVSGLQRRGEELLREQNPAATAAAQLSADMESLRQAFAQRAEDTTGLIDQAGLQQAQDRLLQDRIRQQAPLLAQFSDEVANAVLQGPSRAALQVSDASTVEGQRELNRLLRGDDPARDVNLIELQKQTAAVEELVRIAREGPQVAQ